MTTNKATMTTPDLFPSTTPAELVQPVHGQPMTTSRRVADHFVRDHSNVVRSIRKQIQEQSTDPVLSAFNALNFERVEYRDAKGETRTEYLMTSAGFSAVVLGFTGKEAARLRVRFVMAFDRMAKTLQRQQRALMSAEREKARTEAARQHSAVMAILTSTRSEQGKTTETHHYANEARLIGYAMTGANMGVDRLTLDADQLRLLHRVETQEITLLVRGVEWLARKEQLRALVLKAQADALALEAEAAAAAGEPVPQIGGAA